MAKDKANVLLIENNSADPLALSKLMESGANSHFSIETTNLLNVGLSRLKANKFEMILLDLPLETHKGLDAIRFIKEQAIAIPIFVIDKTEDDTLKEQIKNAGIHEYIKRSELDLKQFFRTMRHALEVRHLEIKLKDAVQELDTAHKKLHSLTDIDNLTAVLNRTGLERALEEEHKRSKRSGDYLSAVLLDCDNFDRINQSFGHGVGDVVLKEVVGRLKDTLRPTDYIARTGGDEFLLLLPETRFPEGMLVAEKVRLAVAESPLRLASETVRLTASLGVLAVSQECYSIEEILSLVRLAVQESKALGKNRVSSGEKHRVLSGNSSDALGELMDKLRQGDCFRAVSMPIYDLRSEIIVGYEMLSRGPVGPFEMPDDLFRVSVEHNLLTAVDLRCLKTCLQALSEPRYKDKANKWRFHVNLFPSTIIDTPIERLMQLFPADIAPERFCVEISEQQFIGDPAYLRDYVVALRKRGLLVAIDDVGFGRSSLESLIILEPDIVKIDRKYVSGISTDEAKAYSLKRLIKVVNALGSELIAEGIEMNEEAKILLDLGVNFGQGWLWGQPN
jgi:diguanylate cyclase (GGDEF)-like protein